MPNNDVQKLLAFVLDLRSQGILLQAEGETLTCDAPMGAITEEIADSIKNNKTGLLPLLRSMEPKDSLPQIVPDPAEAHEPFPLTENQEAYWLGRNNKLESGGVGIHVYFEVEIEDLDEARFQKAWAELVREHAMLRAVLLPEGKQRILKNPSTPTVEILSATKQGGLEAVDSVRRTLSHMQYALSEWPQFQLKIFHLPQENGGPRRSLLMVSMDLWCLDLRSLQVLLDHLADLYLGQTPAPIPEPSFRDYLITLETLKKAPVYDKALAYWHDRIRTLPPAPSLPTRPKSEVKTGRFTRRSHRLPQEQWTRIRERIRSRGLTVPSVLLACYAATISRWSENKRFTLNIPRFNRLPMHEDINDIVGEFASFSLLEVDNRAPVPFKELAGKIQRQMWADLEFAHVSGVRVLRDWKASLQSSPQVMAPFVFTSEPEHSTFRNKSLSWMGALERLGTVKNAITQTPQVWLDSQFSEINGDLYVSWDSLDGLLVEGLPERMFETYCAIISGLGEKAAWEMKTVPLPQKERDLHRLLSGPLEELSGDSPLDCLRRHAKETPEGPALIDGHGVLSWLDAANEVEQWSARLSGLGLGERNAVAFALPKGRKQFIASMAIHGIGGIVVPIDHESPLSRAETILKDCSAAVLLCDENSHYRFLDASCPTVNMDTPDMETLSVSEPYQHSESLYCVIYTSGSTGTPKGVKLSLDGILNVVRDAAQRFGMDREDTALSLSPIYHDLALFDVMRTAIIGTRLVFPEPGRLKDPGHWLQLVRDWNVTTWLTVPATMTMLLDYLDGTSEGTPTPDSLKYVILGGDWIPLATPERLRKIAPRARLISAGGPTETSLWNILYPVKRFDDDWRSIPYGLPIRNAAYHVLDDKLEDCPAMVVGELYCSGPWLASGYLNDEKKTSRSFIMHQAKGVRMFRTGDLGRLHENGYIEFIGRRDNQVNINGYRIELGEIETTIGRHPAVCQAVSSVKKGRDSRDGLVLWVTLKPGKSVDVKELQANLKEHLPQYMQPSSIGITESFPLTPNNKVDRKIVADWATPSRPKAQAEDLPSTPTERLLAKEWADLLGVQGMTLDQNFFEIGGNSIAAVRLYNNIIAGKYTGLSVASIFSFPTIRELAAAMDASPGMDKAGMGTKESSSSTERSAPSAVWPPVTPAPMRLPVAPTTRVQQRMFYEDQRQGKGCYNMSLLLTVNATPSGEMDVDSVEAALNAVIARHEILRTNFIEMDDPNDASQRRVMQKISPKRTVPLERLATEKDADPAKSLRSFCREFTQRPYDLERDPLVRLAWMSESASTAHLLIGFHHIAIDGWSLSLFLRDFGAALAGEQLPPPKLQQVDFALWENSQAFTDMAAKITSFASQKLPPDGLPSVITDAVSVNAAPHRDRDDECFVEERIPQRVMEGIARLSERSGTTSFAVMSTVFGLLAASYNHSDTAQFGTYVAARALPGLEDMLGSMTCPAPLRLQFETGQSMVKAIRATMRQLSESIDTSLLPFEDLVRAIAPVRHGDELPLFGMAFTLDNTPAQPMTAGGMVFTPMGARQYRTSIDLETSVSMTAEGARVVMVFNSEKLRREPVRSFTRRFIHMLEQVAENPDLPVWSLSPATQDDKARAQNRFLPRDFHPERRNLLEYFYAVAEEAPGFTAITETVSSASGPQASATCTLEELRLLADSMTVAMLDRGLSPGQRVGILMERGIKLTAAMLAAQQCAAPFILLPVSMPPQRMREMLDMGDAALVLGESAMAGHEALQNRDVLAVDQVHQLSFPEQNELHESGRLASPAPDDEACLFFTSGSEGRPKGVRLTHGNWINRLEGDWHVVPYDRGEACMAKARTAFIDAFCEVFQPLLKRIPLYVLSEADETDVEKLVDHLDHWKISRAMIVVSLIQGILEVLKSDGRKLGHLRHVMASGERLPAGIAETFYTLLPGCTLHNYYGSTEVAADIVSCAVKPPKAKPVCAIPLGRPMPNNRIEIMNPARMPLPHGMLGEIAIAGPSVTPGYLDNDDSRFFTHDGQRFFAPGDVGMWTEDGELIGFGRRDRQIKIRGQRIETGDVEQVVQRHPRVREAAVFAVGDGLQMQLVACMVLHDSGSLSMEDLRRELRNSLGGAMMPSRFVEVPGIPRTDSGKKHYHKLKKAIPDLKELPAYTDNDLKTETEKTMAWIWETLLGRPVSHRQADFFTCGGHSLLAIRLASLIREHFHITLKVKDIFDTPIFADLSELVELISGHAMRQITETTDKAEGGLQ